MFELKDIVMTSAALLTMTFCLLPILQLLDWRKRGSSDGFSAVGFTFPLLSIGFWVAYMMALEDTNGVRLNVFNTTLFVIYTIVYGYYHPNRSNLYTQLAAVAAVFTSVIMYANSFEVEKERTAVLGSTASNVQIASMFGVVYEMYRVIFVLKTTEYIPAPMVFGGALIGWLWLWAGYLMGDEHMIRANLVGVVINIIQHGLFFVYPPKTWVVPVYGVGGNDKNYGKDKKTN